MSRSLEEIYNESVKVRKERLELTEIENSSKMSVMNAITWVTAAAIHSFESILDAFMLDLIKVFNNRINGTPAYYANAMLKWQKDNKLVVNADGTQFYYPEPYHPCIISHVSYDEKYSSHYQDNMLVLKVAKGEGKNMERLTNDELMSARQYLSQIKFAGVKCQVVSRKGDVLVPKVTVYYDGGIDINTLRGQIDNALVKYINDIPFDSAIYVQKVVDALQAIEHVTDVYLGGENQGIFLAKYNDDDELGPLMKIDRKDYMSSGYLKQSTGQGKEAALPNFKESIQIKLEGE